MNKATKLALINAALYGGGVFAGAFSDGIITWVGLTAALSASFAVFFAQLKQHYGSMVNKRGMSGGLFTIYGA